MANDKMQRKLALKSFLGSSGFKIFAEELGTYVDSNQARLNAILRKPVAPEELADLNINLGIKTGVNAILNILENLRQELEDTSSGPTINGEE